jgi:hypothetical protein
MLAATIGVWVYRIMALLPLLGLLYYLVQQGAISPVAGSPVAPSASTSPRLIIWEDKLKSELG